jgi:regulatory protein
MGYQVPEAQHVIAALVEERILDDERYAHTYVARHAERGQGPVRIAADLRSLGISAELIDTVLRSGLNWHSLAVRVRKAKFGPTVPAAWAQRARQARFLQYRGFSADHIRSALGADLDLD